MLDISDVEMDERLITVKEVVKRYGISFHKVNHYTNLGLLSVADKDGNIRLYDERDLKERLTRISELVKEGYPLRLIRDRLDSNKS